MNRDSQLSTQALVFFLVGSAFTTVYITQPDAPGDRKRICRRCTDGIALGGHGDLRHRLGESPLRDGRAHSLYVLCYSAGAGAEITACGYAYISYAWPGVVALASGVLLLPLGIGLVEIMQERRLLN